MHPCFRELKSKKEKTIESKFNRENGDCELYCDVKQSYEKKLHKAISASFMKNVIVDNKLFTSWRNFCSDGITSMNSFRKERHGDV